MIQLDEATHTETTPSFDENLLRVRDLGPNIMQQSLSARGWLDYAILDHDETWDIPHLLGRPDEHNII